MLDFYKRVISSIGLHTNDEGYIYGEEDGTKQYVTIEGKSLVLPYQDQIRNMVHETDDGLAVVKVLYNPIKENVIKGNSSAIEKTQEVIQYRLGYGLTMVGMLLLELANNKDLQKKASMELNRFFAKIGEAKNANIKQLVDESVIVGWEKLGEKQFRDGYKLIELYIKKSGKSVNGTKYNRLAVVNSPLYDELLKSTKDSVLSDVRMSNKKLVIYKAIFEYVLEGIENEPHTYTYGSNDNECPTFIALLGIYLKIQTRINELGEMLRFVNEEVSDAAITNLEVSMEDLKDLYKYKTESDAVPDEADTRRTIHKPVIPHPEPRITSMQDVVARAQPVQSTPVVDEGDPVERALAMRGQQPITAVRKSQPVVNSYQPVQQPMVQQQPVYQQPVVAYPNTSFVPMQQPMYVQPQVQQPMVQQQYIQPQPVYQQPVFQQGYRQPGLSGLNVQSPYNYATAPALTGVI